jgi:predicted transcriptional regulator
VLAVLAVHARPMTPRQVRDALGGGLAYGTVLTVPSRLMDKCVATRQRCGRAFAYRPVLDKDEIVARGMHRLLGARQDHTGVLSRFLAVLSDEDEGFLADLLLHTRERTALQVTRLMQNPLGAVAVEGADGDIVRVTDGTKTIYLSPAEYRHASERELRRQLALAALGRRP